MTKRKRKGPLRDPLLSIQDDEEITSEESGGEGEPSDASQGEVSGVDADERRIRLAKKILAELEQEKLLKKDELGEDYIQNKLLEDVLKSKGRHFELCADRMMESLSEAKITVKKGHFQTATCIAVLSVDGREYAYTGSKDGSITRWDLETKKIVHKIPYDYEEQAGHRGAVYGLAVSGDGKLLASGGNDRHIRLWSTETHEIVKVFWKAHSKAITCLAFSTEELTLFSGSADRHVIIWDCESYARIHRAIGHNSRVTYIHSIGKDIAVSSGEDCTLRLWDVGRDKQRIYQRYKSPHDCCSMLSRREFVSCSMGGHVSLWNTSRRKATCTRNKVHGNSWVSSIASVPHSDLVVSGSCDEFLRFFKKNEKEIFDAGELKIPRGWINGLRFSESTRFLVAAIGRDHRLGRWHTIKGARNGILIIDLKPSAGEEAKPLTTKLKELNGVLKHEVKNKMETDSSCGEESSGGQEVSSSEESSVEKEEPKTSEDMEINGALKPNESTEMDKGSPSGEIEKPKTSESLDVNGASKVKEDTDNVNLLDEMDIGGGAAESSSAAELPDVTEALGKDISQPSLPESSDKAAVEKFAGSSSSEDGGEDAM